MENKQLPAEVQERINNNARIYANNEYGEETEDINHYAHFQWSACKKNYLAGATAEALKAQQGAAWMKPKDVHKNGIIHCCRMGGRTGYVYHSVVWDADGKRWIGGLSDETREIEVLDESGSNELVAENERLKSECHETKMQADNLRTAYGNLGRQHQQLKERCDKMEAALRQFISYHETGLLPDIFTYKKGIEALKEGESNTPAPGQGKLRWVKSKDFPHEIGMPYHAKDNATKGAGTFDTYNNFTWGDGSVTLEQFQYDLYILFDEDDQPQQ